VRLCLAYGGVPHTNELPQEYFGKGWRDAKADAPYGQLPLLHVETADGASTVLAQTPAICRYVASLAGLIPEDPLAQARADECFMAAEELGTINPIVNVFTGDAFAEKRAAFFDSLLPGKLANIARRLGDGPFFCGENVSHADFNMYHHLDNARSVEPSCLDAHPTLGQFLAAVEGIPAVRAYLDARPLAVDIGTKPMLVPREDQAEGKM